MQAFFWDQPPDEAEADVGITPDELERALAGLPPTQQAVLRMKYYVGLTFREIGEALSISANTAASRCRYALATLRRTLRGTRNGSTEEGGDRT